MSENRPAILMLEDGTTFSGKSFGAIGKTLGEVCFNTGITGYQEILTDPSYAKQIVTMTAPHIGNYGVNSEDIESNKIQASGFVIKEESIVPSNWRSQVSIGDYLQNENIVGIKNIDTRSLTIHLRNNGAMNGIISSERIDDGLLRKELIDHPSMTGQDLAKVVSTREMYKFSEQGKYKVAVLDFGVKRNILKILKKLDCQVSVFPANTRSKEILGISPDGIFLSNGPGDPAAVSYAITTVKEILGKKPMFGICLGHQILALSLGAKTFKLKFGHRGINHPVKNLTTNTVEITSQNHGFAVDSKSIPNNVKETHVNLNDNTNAGVESIDNFAFSVQYHPESSPGPHDSRYLFHKFIEMMNAKKD
jgi:carbamoyl-phosphate synthase small subunit